LNYAGTFDANVSVDADGAHPHEHVHVETITKHAAHVPADAIIVPDAQLLFNGDFKRTGVDLVLTKDDQELVLHDYFKTEKRAALSTPDGAHLTGDLVNALSGHVQVAQADGSASVNKVIGHVTKVSGTATAVRNGVSIILNQGDNVEKGDVVQSGANSTLGLTFIDGTVFGLSSNAKMVLNEMIYDPNGSSNSSLLSLVAGTISFVAGETAKHGDMKIDTPVATMGIRGTAVLVEIDFEIPIALQPGAPTLLQLPTAKFQVLVEPDGSTGSYILYDKATLTPLMTIDKAGQFVSIGNGNITVGNALLSAEVQKLINDVFQQKFVGTDTNTKLTYNPNDSIVPVSQALAKAAEGAVPIVTAVKILTVDNPDGPDDAGALGGAHIAGSPLAVVLDLNGNPVSGFAITEVAHQTGHSGPPPDQVIGGINFFDVNKGDTPTVTASLPTFTYQNAAHGDVTAGLNALQLADIAAVKVALQLVRTTPSIFLPPARS
jgi:hypothetical protein